MRAEVRQAYVATAVWLRAPSLCDTSESIQCFPLHALQAGVRGSNPPVDHLLADWKALKNFTSASISRFRALELDSFTMHTLRLGSDSNSVSLALYEGLTETNIRC